MKNCALVFCLFCFTEFLCAQTPTVQWARSIGGEGNDRANSIETDPAGNLILAGRFQSKTIKIGSTTLAKNPADPDQASDIFIIKLDKNGELIWAIAAGNYGDDHALSCVTDKWGNIYAVGYFESENLQFDEVILRNNNFTAGKENVRFNSDMWVAKFSPQGKCIWARNAGGLDGNGQYSSITLDKENNVVISGIAGAEMNFGDGIKINRKSIGMYVAKYTVDGKLLWVKSPEVGKGGEAHGVGTDPEDNIYMAGFFVPKITFEGASLKSTSEDASDAFLAKYSPAGQLIWAKNFGGEKNEIASCETDPFGNVYLAGLFFSKNIKTGNDSLVNKGLINHFIAKFDKNGKLLWAKSAGGNNGDGPASATREFCVDRNGNAVCTGSNWSEFTFAGKPVKTVAGSEDILLLKYDKDGRELWAADFGGTGRNAGRGVTTDTAGNIFLTGSFDEKNLKFGEHSLTNAGNSDIFIVKFSEQK